MTMKSKLTIEDLEAIAKHASPGIRSALESLIATLRSKVGHVDIERLSKIADLLAPAIDALGPDDEDYRIEAWDKYAVTLVRLRDFEGYRHFIGDPDPLIGISGIDEIRQFSIENALSVIETYRRLWTLSRALPNNDLPAPPHPHEYSDSESYYKARGEHLRVYSDKYASLLDSVKPMQISSGTISARGFPNPPNLDDFKGLAQYLLAVVGWADSIKSSAHQIMRDNKSPLYRHDSGKDDEVALYGALAIAGSIAARASQAINWLDGPPPNMQSKFRDEGVGESDAARWCRDYVARHVMLMERDIERWRSSAAAGAGNQGRPVAWYRRRFRAARKAGITRFDDLLDWLESDRNEGTFLINRDDEIIEFEPDNPNDPIKSVRFSAAKRTWERLAK